MERARKIRLAYVVSHPIQYQADLLRRIAAHPSIDLTVFFCSDFSARAYTDAGFGVSVEWDVPLLDGYRYVVLPRSRETSHPGPTRPIARGFFRHLRRGMDGEPFDALWVHGYATVNAMHAMLAAYALGIPVLLRAESWLRDRPRSRLKLALKQLSFALLRPLVAAVLPIGTRNSDYWRFYLGDSTPQYLMPYAVNNDFFAARTAEAAPHRQSLQQELQLDPARPVILFASKLQERKHCDHLLRAFLNLPASTAPRPYLVIVGDGEMRASLEAAAQASTSPDVRFVGFRNQRDLPRFFDLATVFVLPSRHEPWGLIVNEAMAAGLPVIVSTDVGSHADLVEDGVNGFVYPTGDIPALTSALAQTLQKDNAIRMGEASRRIIARCSFEADIRGLLAALSAVTGHSEGAH